MRNHRIGRVVVLLAAAISVGLLPLVAKAQRVGEIAVDSGWQLQDVAKVPEAGETVSQTSYSPGGWYKATVPGTVLTSLVNAGVYPDPLYGENGRPEVIPDSLCRTSYWYRTSAAIPAAFAGKHVWLQFDGINYLADVWVNGKEMGMVKGAFTRGVFDITSAVTPGQSAVIAVKILPPPHPNTPNQHTIAAGVGQNGGILTEDGPTFLCTQGWNWIPGIPDRDIGIWQKVTLWASGPVVVMNPFVTADLPRPNIDSANLTVEATVRNVSDTAQSGMLVALMDPNSFQVPVTLKPGETQTFKITTDDTRQLHLDHPRLWWPNGYGEPNLYKMRFQFDVGDAPSDTTDVSFGIRKIDYQLPDSDNLAISVNGVPVFCKGGNWGMDEALKRIPRDRLEAQIRLHAQAHFTMIRNWVGQSTSEDFYDLCDKYGILVWDEFFQPNPADGPNPVDADLYLANVWDTVMRFRNHPSIALWCARNEGNPPPAIDDGIRKIMGELEPQRLYQANSSAGRGVRSGGPYMWRTPRMYYSFPDNEAFKTELGGGVSMPTLEAVHAMIPQKDWDTINDDWAEHNFTRGTQGGQLYADIITSRYGRFANLVELDAEAQLANYEAYRALFEGRQAKMFAPVTGVLDWMTNPTIYSFTYQLFSHDLEPMASLFAAEKACEPVHVQMNQDNFHAMVINNTPERLSGATVMAQVFDMDGTARFEQHWTVDAKASGATDAGAIDFPADLSAVHFVKVTLRDASGPELSENFYWRANPDHPDDFTAMRSMPTVDLNANIVRRDQNGKCLLDVTLTNPISAGVALLAHVQLRRKSDGQRVLPVFYSDNYVSLLGGEKRTIRIEAAASDLAGDEPLVMLDGWNVTTAAKSFTEGGMSSIAPNVEAMRGSATRP